MTSTKPYGKTLILPKARTEKISIHFSAGEFHCRCDNVYCCTSVISLQLLKCLDTLRLLTETPLYVTSAYRCQSHNMEVRGALTSRHLSGEAVDLLCPEHIPLLSFENMAVNSGFSFVKRYENPMRLHCDIR